MLSLCCLSFLLGPSCHSSSDPRLLSSGQLKLARKIERLKHPHAHHELPAPLSPIDHSPAAGTAPLDPLTLPPTVEVILVSDAVTLERACLRARQGGVVGFLASWKRMEEAHAMHYDNLSWEPNMFTSHVHITFPSTLISTVNQMLSTCCRLLSTAFCWNCRQVARCRCRVEALRRTTPRWT